MSRRTSAANKAIAQAWENERNNVLQGKGTRDWTPEQQQAILDKGKAYDESGRAFEGQHMKSVGEYPQYQGDPGNIQFLTREEHLEAHLGNWQNPTNWYFDPVTKEMTDFGDNPFIPCEVIELDDPVVKRDVTKADSADSTKVDRKDAPKREGVDSSAQSKHQRQHAPNSQPGAVHTNPSVLSKVGHAFKAVGGFLYKHREVIKTGGKIAAGVVGTIVVERITDGNRGTGDQRSDSVFDDYPSFEEGNSFDRSSPREHDVSGYTRRQNGKDVHVRPYKRGGTKNE